MGDPFDIAAIVSRTNYGKCSDCRLPADTRLNALHERIAHTLDQLDTIIERKK